MYKTKGDRFCGDKTERDCGSVMPVITGLMEEEANLLTVTEFEANRRTSFVVIANQLAVLR